MMKCACVFVCVSIILTFTSVNSDTPESRTIRLSQGFVRGYEEPKKYRFAFYGIPYATAPKGAHRFKAPLPAPTWDGTLEAIDKGVICPQAPTIRQLIPNKVSVQDDCLILNVFVPNNAEKNLPVVVYVHGGGYHIGYGNMASHVPLIKSGKIIEVNFNYRLGALGFLCLGTEDAPGNAGMKDQLAALRWVQENIASFGGNPNEVTLAGFSAGSAAVDLLMLSEAARGLFNKVILESGVAINSWSVQIDPLANAKYFASLQNFDNVDDIYALEEFYKTASLDLLLASDFMDRTDILIFVPCVETQTSEEIFLKDDPISIIKKGNFNRLPLLVGFSNMEGIFRIPLLEHLEDKMNDNFSYYLPADLTFPNEEEKERVAKEVKQFYFGDKRISEENLQNFIDYFSDTLFTYFILRAVNYYLEAGSDSIYVYEYSYVDEDLPKPFNVNGADHCSQSNIISENLIYNEHMELPEKFQAVREMLSDLWVNFITTGKPVPRITSTFPSGWPAITLDNPIYMDLNLSPKLRTNLLKTQREFWDPIYDRYHYTPSPVPAPKEKRSEL